MRLTNGCDNNSDRSPLVSCRHHDRDASTCILFGGFAGNFAHKTLPLILSILHYLDPQPR